MFTSSPTPRDLAVTSRLGKPTVYPRPILRTKRYCSAVSYALLNALVTHKQKIHKILVNCSCNFR